MYQSDENIIQGCRKGDRKAQKALFSKYKSMLFKICLRYAADRYQAEDFLQDGLIKIFSNLYQYKPTAAFGAWIRTIMVNVCLQHLRKEKRMFKTQELNEQIDQYDASEALFTDDRTEAVMKMVQRLPRGSRLVFNLYLMEGYSHKEVAKELGITASGSRAQLTRAKTMLRKMLEKSLSIELTKNN